MAQRIKSHFFFAVSAMAIAICSQSATAQVGGEPTQHGPVEGAEASPQKDAQSPSDNGEIVVTARMRQELLKDVPIAVTALNAKQLQDRNVRDVSDFIGLTPNITVSQSQSAGLSQITIRGVTQVRNSNSPVAVIVDGVQQVDPNEFAQQLFDLNSVEVLRGPQSALYGRNASGGAIIMTTQQPTNDFVGHVMAGGGTGREYSGEAVVSGPLIRDKLLFRLGVAYTDRLGYFENINLNQKQDPYRDLVGRVLLKWNVTDDFKLDFRYSHSYTRGGALNFWYQPVNLAADGRHIDQTNPFGSGINDANAVQRHFYSADVGYGLRNIDQASIKAEYNFGFATLSSVSAFDKTVELITGNQFPYTADLDMYGINGTQSQYTNRSAFSQELRLTSRGDTPLRWMVGAYYLRSTRFISSTTGENRGLGILRIRRTPQFDSTINPTESFLADNNHDYDVAVFSNVDYDILPHLQASVGLRYDSEHRRQTVSEFNTHGTPGTVNRATFSKLQPKYTLTYKPTEEFTIYGSYGIGFRSGQFNQNGVSGAAQTAGINGVTDLVPAETVRTSELGFKTSLFDRRLRLSGSAYHTIIRNSEYFVFLGALEAQVLVPINKVRVQGVEIEANATLGGGFEGIVALGLTDAKIRSYEVDPSDVGNWAPYVPNSTLNAGLQYRTKLMDGIGIMARVDYRRLGRQYWDPENSTPRDAVDLVDIRAGLEDPDGQWSVTATVQNLTDKVYNAEYLAGGFVAPANPRVVRVQLRYNF